MFLATCVLKARPNLFRKDGQIKARFTDEQIIAIIKEQESDEIIADVCRRYGISSSTFYKYKSKYSGMESSDAKLLRALDDENSKLE